MIAKDAKDLKGKSILVLLEGSHSAHGKVVSLDEAHLILEFEALGNARIQIPIGRIVAWCLEPKLQPAPLVARLPLPERRF